MLFVAMMMLTGILAALFDIGMSKLISRLVAQREDDSVIFVRLVVTLYFFWVLLGLYYLSYTAVTC